jgi:hypothetical protein
MATGWPMKTTYADGDVYSASDVNDITGTINLLGSSVAYTAGKNKIINGDMRVWQRGTTFSNPFNGAYTADRFIITHDGTGATRTISQQTFTPGTAPVAGYEGAFFYRYAVSVAGTSNTYNFVNNRIEDVRAFAGTTVTVSFWAKADAARSVTIQGAQNFGTGGSSTVGLSGFSNSVTTSWQRFTGQMTIPSISGKTIGTSSYLELEFNLPFNTTFSIDIWGVQMEQGSTATAFQTSTGTIQGELAACQRYYYRISDDTGLSISNGCIYQGTAAYSILQFPVQMRVAPTLAASVAGVAVVYALNTSYTGTANAFGEINTKAARWVVTISGATFGNGCWMQFNGTSKYIEASAEL